MRTIYVDPAYAAYYQDRLFDVNDPVLNRDDTLAPYIRLQATLKQQNIAIHTADFLLSQKTSDVAADYYSFGVLENYHSLSALPNVRMRAFIIFEPPVVAPNLYRELPALTSVFECVYVHNTDGDGYSLQGVDKSKLRKLYWPQPHKDVLVDFWDRDNRLRRIVMINGNHKPASFHGELYSKRIAALVALAKFDAVDLYGRGWERWWSRSAMWLPYWLHRKTLMSIYKGACKSKFEILSQYSFALCFENMAMEGYVTEKIFDCFYAGTIPIYLGAKDITNLIPPTTFIDCRKFQSWKDVHDHLIKMPALEIQSIRKAGREFIQSGHGLKYYDSLITIFHA